MSYGKFLIPNQPDGHPMNDRRSDGSTDPLRELWAREDPPHQVNLEDLRADAARARRRTNWVIAGEVLITAVLIGQTIRAVRGEPQLGDGLLPWLTIAWATWVMAVAFAAWNRLGARRAHTETARDYLALSEARARARMRTAAFVLVLTVALGSAIVALGGFGWILAAVVALYLGWALWYGRRAWRDLATVRQVVAEFDDSGDRL